MKNSNSIRGMIALISVPASAVFAYLAGSAKIRVYGFIALALGAVFVWAIASCMAETARRHGVMSSEKERKLKKEFRAFCGEAAIIFLFSCGIASYLWGATGAAGSGVVALVCGSLFVWAASVCLTDAARQETEVATGDFARHSINKAA